MQSIITGKAFVLGDNVDTDQIIPAQYLTLNPAIPEEYKMFGKYRTSRACRRRRPVCPRGTFRSTPGGDEFVSAYKIIVAGQELRLRLGPRTCPDRPGRGRHRAVVAEFYARIFYRNSVNGGYLVPLRIVRPPVRPGLHRRRAGDRRRGQSAP